MIYLYATERRKSYRIRCFLFPSLFLFIRVQRYNFPSKNSPVKKYLFGDINSYPVVLFAKHRKK
jgi:hypothetical protein